MGAGDMEEIVQRAQELLVLHGPKVVYAILILIIGRWVARIAVGFLTRFMKRSEVDPTLALFTRNLAYYGLLVFVLLAALAELGIQTTAFIAVLGAAGLAVGLSLQSSLANFAAGLLMIIFRPFKVGHYIEAAGTSGTVEEIHIFSTILKTPDNTMVIVPNGKVINDNIKNYSSQDIRRVDLTVGISYDDDLKKARSALENMIAAEKRVLENPEHQIVVTELGESSVNLAVRMWTKAEDYWSLFFDMNERVKTRFDEEGIRIPYPQRDIHLYQSDLKDSA
jgi:small conductance mechanosensitive channel